MNEVWDRQEGEPLIWYQRFTRYRLMFPKRTIATVFAAENSEKLGKTRKPDDIDGTWYAKAKQWKWEERAEAWDAVQYAEEEKLRARVLKSGWALDHQRILTLTEKARKLADMMDDPEKVWLPDVKSVGTGPTAERVDLVQFNADLFREFREYLTDIAEETGGRSKKQEMTVKGLPKVYYDLDPNEDGSEP